MEKNGKRRYIELYRNDIENMLELKWWVGKSDLEIVVCQLYVRGLERICEYHTFMKALINVLGRPVSKAELIDQDALIDEFETKYPDGL